MLLSQRLNESWTDRELLGYILVSQDTEFYSLNDVLNLLTIKIALFDSLPSCGRILDLSLRVRD